MAIIRGKTATSHPSTTRTPRSTTQFLQNRTISIRETMNLKEDDAILDAETTTYDSIILPTYQQEENAH